MIETSSQLVNSLGSYWSNLDSHVSVTVVDEETFLDNLTSVYEMGDTVMRGAHAVGAQVLQVSPWGLEQRQQVVNKLRSSSGDPTRYDDPEPPKGTIPRAEAEQRVRTMLDNNNRERSYYNSGRIKRTAEGLKYLFGNDSNFPAATGGTAGVPDIIVFDEDGTDEVSRQIVVREASEERYRSGLWYTQQV